MDFAAKIIGVIDFRKACLGTNVITRTSAAMENLKRNQHILSTLGKIPEDFDLNQMEQPQQQCGASKPSAVWETAAEFLRLGTSEIISDLLQIHIIS